MKVVAMVGSFRKGSYNQKLYHYIKTRYHDQFELEQLPIQKLPIYHQDDETNPPQIVSQVKEKIKASDGVMIITPEYNHSIPAVLKNALDWASRVDKVMVNKPVMIAGTSPGVLGTVRAQEHLRQILKSPGVSAFTLPGNEVFIGGIHEKMDDQGNLLHQPTIEFLDEVINQFVNWIVKTKELKW